MLLLLSWLPRGDVKSQWIRLRDVLGKHPLPHLQWDRQYFPRNLSFNHRAVNVILYGRGGFADVILRWGDYTAGEKKDHLTEADGGIGKQSQTEKMLHTGCEDERRR